MKKNSERLSHAIHNEEVCNYLEIRSDIFADWIITTAFYSALHFVSYKIFPFEVPKIEGKKIPINNVDEFYNYKNGSKGGKQISKHELLGDLVNKHCAPVSEDYDWLLDMSMTARYSDYKHDKEIANKARRLMSAIKKHCN